MKISVAEASRQLHEQVEALQAEVERLTLRGSPDSELLAGPRSSTGRGTNVLWVDDHPEFNVFEIKSLADRGYVVRQERSSRSALSVLESSGPFGVVISDLGRTEDGRYDPDAGRWLAREIRSRGISVPMLIYTTEEAAQGRRGELVEAGATGVTGSSAELLRLVTLAPALELERQVGSLVEPRGFARGGPGFPDFVGILGGRRMGVAVRYLAASAHVGRRLRGAIHQIERVVDTGGVDEGLVVVGGPLKSSAKSATGSKISTSRCSRWRSSRGSSANLTTRLGLRTALSRRTTQRSATRTPHEVQVRAAGLVLVTL